MSAGDIIVGLLQLGYLAVVIAGACSQKRARKRPSARSTRTKKTTAACSSTRNVATAGGTRSVQNVIFHSVSRYDTLPGLSLLYNVPMQEIRIANGLFGDQIQHLRLLLIPLPSTQSAKSQEYLASPVPAPNSYSLSGSAQVD
jgi:hypothetical protein